MHSCRQVYRTAALRATIAILPVVHDHLIVNQHLAAVVRENVELVFAIQLNIEIALPGRHKRIAAHRISRRYETQETVYPALNNRRIPSTRYIWRRFAP